MFRSVIAGSLLIAATAVQAAGAAPQQPPATVMVSPAQKITVGYAKKYPGEISSFKDVQIIPRITGTFQKKFFAEGDIVKEGEQMFQFEDVTYKAKVDSAKAVLDQLRAELRYNERNYNRNKTLNQSRAVSQSALDEAEEKLETVRAKILGAEADLRDAENTLSYTKVYAPFTGRVGKVSLSAGNLVTPSTGSLATVTMVAPVYVVFSVGEKVFRSEFGGREGFPKNAVIKVELADGSLYSEEAKVAIIDSKIDPVTNTIKIWGTFQNPDHQLLVGSYVTIRLGSRLNINLTGVVPSAMQVDNQGPFVYIVGADGNPQRRDIVPGNVNGDLLEIKRGVEPGESVVVDGMHKIRPGVKIAPVPYQK